jgi:hypothetical protein
MALGTAVIAADAVLPALRDGRGSLPFTGGGYALYPSKKFASLSVGKAALRTYVEMLHAHSGRYYLTVRRQQTIRAMPAALDAEGDYLLPEAIVPFPRGFGFGPDGRLYLSSGVGPSGEGDNTIVVFDRCGALLTHRLVTNPKLSPLDLKVAPNGNIVVASEWPFGAADAVPSVREYDPITGQLVRVFAPERSVGFHRPRGLRFGPDGRLTASERTTSLPSISAPETLSAPSCTWLGSTLRCWSSCLC